MEVQPPERSRSPRQRSRSSSGPPDCALDYVAVRGTARYSRYVGQGNFGLVLDAAQNAKHGKGDCFGFLLRHHPTPFVRRMSYIKAGVPCEVVGSRPVLRQRRRADEGQTEGCNLQWKEGLLGHVRGGIDDAAALGLLVGDWGSGGGSLGWCRAKSLEPTRTPPNPALPEGQDRGN